MANIAGGTIVWELEAKTDAIDEAFAKASKSAKNTADDIKDSSKSMSESLKNIGSNFKTTGTELTVGITAPILAVGGSAIKLTEVAGKYSSVKDAFKSMTQGMGIDAEKFQNDVSKATGGQIDNLTILQGATRGLALIGKGAFNDFGQDYVKMAEYSKKAARATGQGVDYMFNSLVLGISRESKLILDNLGISVDTTAAKEAYAASLGKASDELTQSEEKHAVLNATLAKLEETYGNVAVSAGGFGGAWQQLTTNLTNSSIAIGLELEPEMAKLTKSLTKLIDDSLPKIIDIVRDAINWWASLSVETQQNIVMAVAFVAAVGPVLVIVGTVITTIGTLISILSALKTVLIVAGTVMGAIGAPILIVIGIIAALIAIGVLLYRNWDTIIAKLIEWKNILVDNVRYIGNLFGQFVSTIWNAMRSAGDAMTRPFRDAWNYIEGIARRIREALENINPWHRNSPSLIDNIRSGVREIQKQYGSLQSLELPQLSSSSSMSSGYSDYGATAGGQVVGGRSSTINQVNNIYSQVDMDIAMSNLNFALKMQ